MRNNKRTQARFYSALFWAVMSSASLDSVKADQDDSATGQDQEASQSAAAVDNQKKPAARG